MLISKYNKALCLIGLINKIRRVNLKVLNKILGGLLIASLATSTPAVAKIKTVDEFLKEDKVMIYSSPVVNSSNSTNWYANPYAVLSPTKRHLKPEIMMIYVSSEGYSNGFENLVQLNCKNPIQSHIVHDPLNDRSISFKESMAYPNNRSDKNFVNRLDRGAVEALFNRYC